MARSSRETEIDDWHRDACFEWIKNEPAVKKFILETMKKRLSRRESLTWDSFSESKTWAFMRDIMPTETQFKFHRLWLACEDSIFEDGASDNHD